MWPFARKTQPDPVLVNVNAGVLAAIGALQQQVLVLQKRVELVDENSVAARSLDKAVEKIAAQASSTRGLLEDHVSRLDQAVTQLRGQVTGGRGGRPSNGDRQVLEIGRALVESLGLERAAQLANEVVDRHNGVANGKDPNDPDSVFA